MTKIMNAFECVNIANGKLHEIQKVCICGQIDFACVSVIPSVYDLGFLVSVYILTYFIILKIIWLLSFNIFYNFRNYLITILIIALILSNKDTSWMRQGNENTFMPTTNIIESFELSNIWIYEYFEIFKCLRISQYLNKEIYSTIWIHEYIRLFLQIFQYF